MGVSNPETYKSWLEEDAASEASDTGEDLSAARVSFVETYKAMDKECQWVLSSGRTVEGVIFDACQGMDADLLGKSLIQSFVLDISDPKVQGLFTSEEWDEIRGHVLPLPKPDEVLIDSMRRFFCVGRTSLSFVLPPLTLKPR